MFLTYLARQVNEGVRVQILKDHCALNSNSEFHPVVRIKPLSGLKEAQGDAGEGQRQSRGGAGEGAGIGGPKEQAGYKGTDKYTQTSFYFYFIILYVVLIRPQLWPYNKPQRSLKLNSKQI